MSGLKTRLARLEQRTKPPEKTPLRFIAERGCPDSEIAELGGVKRRRGEGVGFIKRAMTKLQAERPRGPLLVFPRYRGD